MEHKCSLEECGSLLGYHHYWYLHNGWVEGCPVCDAEKESRRMSGYSTTWCAPVDVKKEGHKEPHHA